VLLQVQADHHEHHKDLRFHEKKVEELKATIEEEANKIEDLKILVDKEARSTAAIERLGSQLPPQFFLPALDVLPNLMAGIYKEMGRMPENMIANLDLVGFVTDAIKMSIGT
jgi:hypothetical protein